MQPIFVFGINIFNITISNGKNMADGDNKLSFQKINSEHDLIVYALRKLGQPVINIEIDEEQIYGCLRDALDFYQEFHYDATQSIYFIHKITKEDMERKYLDLSPDVTVNADGEKVNIKEVLRVLSLDEARLTSSIWDIRYQLRLHEYWDLSTTSYVNYVLTMQHLRLMDQLFIGEVPTRFQKHMHRLYIDWDWGNYSIQEGQHVVVECTSTIDPEQYPDIYNDRWLRQYFVALMKRQWGANLKKYNNTPLLGDVRINGQQIYDEAIQEIKDLEDQLYRMYTMPLQYFIN